jgi:hypothetical protein
MYIQIIQLAINGSPLCQIGYDNQVNEYDFVWISEEYADDFKVEINPEDCLIKWIDEMKNKTNNLFSNIKILEYRDMENIIGIDDYIHFISSKKIKDLVDAQTIIAWQIDLIA